MVTSESRKFGSYTEFSQARSALESEGYTLSQDERDGGEGDYRSQLWFRADDGAQVTITYERKIPASTLEPYTYADGTLRAFTDVGCYPLFYFTGDDCLCNECAAEERERVRAVDVNWEDPDLYCGECGDRIESAYAEDDATADTDPAPEGGVS